MDTKGCLPMAVLLLLLTHFHFHQILTLTTNNDPPLTGANHRHSMPTISEESPIKLHSKTNTHMSLILTDLNCLFSVDFDTLDDVLKHSNHIEVGGGGTTRVLGSCNGLLALFNDHEDFALWNPSTRKCHKLPATPFEIPKGFSNSLTYGFGYDPVSDDYKLVRMVEYTCKHQDSMESQGEIYSLKSNSWRLTRDSLSYHSCDLKCGILANNALHWVVSRKPESYDENIIVAFDVRFEEYFEVPQPEYMDNNCDMSLYALGGCLCIVCHHDNTHVDVWVMKEYGVKESWINLFLFVLKNGNEILSPVAYSKSGDGALFYEEYDDYYYDDDDGEFVWYDLRGKRSEEVRIQGVPKSKSFEVEMCVASLVPLNGGSGTNAMNQQAPVKKKKKKNRKKR